MFSSPKQIPSYGDDEQVVLWIAFFVGLLPAAVAIARGLVWGAEPTIGLLVCALAALGLFSRWHTRRLRSVAGLFAALRRRSGG